MQSGRSGCVVAIVCDRGDRYFAPSGGSADTFGKVPFRELSRAMRDPKKHPWIDGDLVIPRSVLDRVDEEARRSYAADEESCGFLVGPAQDGLRIDGLVPMVTAPTACIDSIRSNTPVRGGPTSTSTRGSLRRPSVAVNPTDAP